MIKILKEKIRNGVGPHLIVNVQLLQKRIYFLWKKMAIDGERCEVDF